MEEWFKGLEDVGEKHKLDALRFEQWETGVTSQVHIDPGSTTRLSASVSPAYSLAASSAYSHQYTAL